MLKIVIYIPEDALSLVKSAIFAAGAGRYDGYDNCSWETKGTGQFRPLTGSQPSVGEIGQVERVTEYRLETICDEACLQNVLAAARRSHPYEVPAIDVLKLEKYRMDT